MQFSSHESVSLDKQINLTTELVRTNSKNLNETYEITRCADWIKSNQFKKVCLQFPDYLLADSSEIVLKLQTILGQTLYILGDTAYGSCCIDYVAAAHINADAIIHFGPKCFSKTASQIPCLCIYEKKPIDLEKFATNFNKLRQNIDGQVEILLDTMYIHKKDKLENLIEQTVFHTIDDNLDVVRDKIILFISDDKRKLLNLNLTFHPKTIYYYECNTNELKLYEEDGKLIKRRYFLIEKIKDSKTIGIVIGTIGVANYLEIIDRMKKLINRCGKKYYLISVGKPTVAKLANLGDIDVYVMVTCAMNEIYESRDFYKPIVTPYDIEMALNDNNFDTNNFTYDFNSFLSKTSQVVENLNEDKLDVSLLTGHIRNLNKKIDENIENDERTNDLAVRNDGTLALNSSYGAGFLANRSWKGLEQNLGKNDVKLAEEGRSGVAQSYQNENS